MKQLKAAVIGLGRMGAEPSVRLQGTVPDGWLPISHVEALQATEGLELLALCDNDDERLKRLSEHYGINQSYKEFKELIDDVHPEFLCIATRTLERDEIIKYACQNGVKIIYTEKPISRCLSSTKDILNVVKNNNVTLGYGVNRRYHAVYRKAKQIIASGELGELREIIIESGVNTLLWAHPHSMDSILFFAGSTAIDFIQGSCKYQNDYQPTDSLFIDDDPIIENAFFQFSNGIKASINQTGGHNVRLACTKGIITVYADGSYLEKITGTPKTPFYFNQSQVIRIQSQASATVTAFNELKEAFLYKKQLPITIQEIETGMSMLIGVVFSSINEGKRVKPENIPENMIITGRTGHLYA
jgi:scyllo-inositol 2-dehydrogenase (NAD+)